MPKSGEHDIKRETCRKAKGCTWPKATLENCYCWLVGWLQCRYKTMGTAFSCWFLFGGFIPNFITIYSSLFNKWKIEPLWQLGDMSGLFSFFSRIQAIINPYANWVSYLQHPSHFLVGPSVTSPERVWEDKIQKFKGQITQMAGDQWICHIQSQLSNHAHQLNPWKSSEIGFPMVALLTSHLHHPTGWEGSGSVTC